MKANWEGQPRMNANERELGPGLATKELKELKEGKRDYE